MFADRVEELKSMQEQRDMTANKSRLLVIYGRRRVGKTTLAREFLRKNRGVYVFVEQKSEDLVLRDCEEAIGDVLGYSPRVESWDGFMDIAFREKMVVVLDEFQNLGAVNPAIFSKLQRIWDERAQAGGVLFIAIGSYVGMMKKLFRDARQPLFGRASGFMRLKPFDFKNTVGFLTNNSLSFEECVIAYSVFGGVPRYLAEIENGIDDIHRLLYSPLAPLKDEGRNILSMEFGSEHKGYFSILESISRGRSTPKEIADYAGMEIGTVAKYLGELSQEYDIVAKHLPIACTNKKRVRYKLDDNFFDFWFKFIYSRLSRIEMYPDDAYSSMLDELDAFVGRKFEGIVREVLVDTRHPLVPTKTGSWWSRTGDEIDIVALDEKNGRALFVETKWRNRPADWSIAERLMAKAEMVQWHNAERKELYLVVSKSGFTQRCLERMDNEGVLHWDMSDLEKIVGGTLPN